eukprot:gnl/Spiro4/5600_TR2849_c0_g1_i1.p1 gnl/Spiro4/5600_TR2849_c0_g1~~gnl/Spiro4/5600_TR2849_c0_g1_i1.p1  ORF type:complete len:167 (+),score=26.26 gnl/Spiro4/5600_TR2849_c0_g1_i1:529-1029(+)
MPMRVCVDSSDNIVVAEYFNHRIQVFDSDCNFLHKFGTQGAAAGQFDHPRGLCCGPDSDIFVADLYNYRIQQFRNNGTFVCALGCYGSGPAQFRYPHGVSVDDSGNIFVADSDNQRIQQLRSDGTFVRVIGSGRGPAQFYCPDSICIADGAIFVADTGLTRILEFR